MPDFLDILLTCLYTFYGLSGLYTALMVTRIEKQWFEEHGVFTTFLCWLFILATWPVILGLHIRYRRK